MEERPYIRFEFIGGPHDGKILGGIFGEGDDAERCYLHTSHGTLGFLFKIASEYAVEMLLSKGPDEVKRRCIQRHFYVVADRLEDQSEIHVRAEYVPEATRTERHSS